MVLVVAGNVIWAQSTIQPRNRLQGEITESDMVALPGNVYPALARAVSGASVDANFLMEYILLLKPGGRGKGRSINRWRSSMIRGFLSF